MENPKSGEANAQRKASEDLLDERKSEATSNERLSDLQQGEKNSTSVSRKQDPGPSPDGTSDENDEAKDAGPM